MDNTEKDATVSAVEQPTGNLTDEQIDEITKKHSTALRGWEWSGDIIEVNGYREYEFAREIARAAIAAHLARQAQAAQPSEPTDISQRLREYAGNPGYSHNDYADTMRLAADECERFYGGMMNWKANAQAKDRTIIELRATLEGQSQATKAQAVPSLAAMRKELDRITWEGEDAGWNLAITAVQKRIDEILATPTAQEVTQQAAKAETAEQDAREMAIAQAVRRACADCYSPDDLADDWSEKMGDLNLSSIIKSVAPTTSTVSAPDEIRNQAYAKCIEIAESELSNTNVLMSMPPQSSAAFSIINRILFLRTSTGQADTNTGSAA